MQLPQHERRGEPASTVHLANGKPEVEQVCVKPGVLVVDDDHLVRVMVQLGLERDGFEVWLADDGRDALELYREHREHIAVVLVDIQMPRLDGLRTLDALRELNPDVLACVMSGSMYAYEPEELRQRGAAQVIAKPFRLDQMARMLWHVVRGVPSEPPSPDGEYEV